MYNFPNIGGLLLTIDDPTVDRLNPSCLSNHSRTNHSLFVCLVSFRIHRSSRSNQNIVTIRWRISLPELLTHHSVRFTGIQSNISVQGGYEKPTERDGASDGLLTCSNRRSAAADDRHSVSCSLISQISPRYERYLISSCVIASMCVPNLEFQLVNPTTQVALFSVCLGNCSSLRNITWNVYQALNASASTFHWSLFNQMSLYRNIWFFGRSSSVWRVTRTSSLSV